MCGLADPVMVVVNCSVAASRSARSSPNTSLTTNRDVASIEPSARLQSDAHRSPYDEKYRINVGRGLIVLDDIDREIVCDDGPDIPVVEDALSAIQRCGRDREEARLIGDTPVAELLELIDGLVLDGGAGLAPDALHDLDGLKACRVLLHGMKRTSGKTLEKRSTAHIVVHSTKSA